MKQLLFFLLLFGVMAPLFTTTITGCTEINPEQRRQDSIKLANVEALMANQQNPTIGYSMDRYLLSERLTRFNDPNKMTYLYITLMDGSWLKVTIIGKLASTSKRLTSPERVTYSSSYGYYTTVSPDEMGTYGSSEPAKVGLTTLGSMLEFGGFVGYIYSEVPLTFSGLERPVIEIQPIVLDKEEKKDFLNSLDSLKQQAR